MEASSPPKPSPPKPSGIKLETREAAVIIAALAFTTKYPDLMSGVSATLESLRKHIASGHATPDARRLEKDLLAVLDGSALLEP